MIDSDDDGVIDTPSALNGTTTYIISNNSRGILFDGADTIPTITEGGDVPNGSAWEYEMSIFYIRDTGTDPTLARRTLRWNGAAMGLVTEDLIAGVENMSFLFGLDTNGDGEIDTYNTIGNMLNTQWTQVAAIEADVLVRSETIDVAHTDLKTYSLSGLGADLGPFNDNFHRMVMQNTVTLRNPKYVLRGNL
jgi:type IV pilus assembly protein PilW